MLRPVPAATRCSRGTPATPAAPARQGCRRSPSDAFQQLIEVEARAPAEVLGMRSQEFLRGAAAIVAQHAEEGPFGVQLGRIAELDHEVAGDAVDAHAGP